MRRFVALGLVLYLDLGGSLGVLSAAEKAIEPSWFTIQSSAGFASWEGSSLTLDFSSPRSSGYTRTQLLRTSLLPKRLVGIAFKVRSTQPHVVLSFALLVYDEMANGQGHIQLWNDATPPPPDLESFTRRKCGFDMLTSDCTDVFLGSEYSPLSLVQIPPIQSFPQFRLEFSGGLSEGDASVVLEDIRWITSDVAFSRGDANSDGNLDVSDAVRTLLFLFGGLASPCEKAMDADDNGQIDLGDAVGLLNAVMLGGLPPGSPFQECGEDPTDDALACEAFPPCAP